MSTTSTESASAQFFATTLPVEGAFRELWARTDSLGAVTSDGVRVGQRLYVGVGSAVASCDILDGSPGPTLPLPAGAAGPVGVLAACPAGLAIAAGNEVWLSPPSGPMRRLCVTYGPPGSKPTPVTWMAAFGRGLAVASSQCVVLLDEAGEVIFRDGSDDGVVGDPVVLDGRLYYVLEGGYVFGARVEGTLVERAQYVVKDPGTPTLLGTDGEALYLGVTERSTRIQRLSPAPMKPLWDTPRDLKSVVTSNVLGMADGVYVAAGRRLFRLEPKTGAERANVQLEQEVQGGLRSVAGQVQGLGTSTIFAYNLGTRVVRTEQVGAAARWLGVAGDVAYVTAGGGRRAISLAALTRAFDVDIELLQDFHDGDGVSGAALATFQVRMALKDQSSSRGVSQQVRVWSVEPATLWINGEPTSVDADTPAELETDSSGTLRFRIAAEDLFAPQLLVWASFMPPTERVAVLPDASTHERLATIDADTLRSSKDYGGASLLTDAYQDDAGDIASALNNALTMSRDTRVRTARNAEWLTPRSANRGAFTVRSTDVDEGFPEVARPVVTTLDWGLDITEDAAEYFELGRGDPHPLQARLATRKAARGPRGESAWQKLKKGAARLEKVVVMLAKDAADETHALVEYVEEGLRDFEKLVVETAEHAAVLAQSILRSVGRSIKSVVEALSFVFSWDTVLEINQGAHTLIFDMLAMLVDDPEHFDAARAAVAKAFATAEASVDGAFDRVRAKVDKRRLNDTNYGGGAGDEHADPQKSMDGVKQSWMLDRVLDFFRGGGSTRGRSPDHLPTFTPSATLLQAFLDALAKVEHDAGAAITAALRADLAALAAITPSQLLTGSISALLTIVQGLVDVVLEVGASALDALLSLVPVILRELRDWLRSPVTLPFLGALKKDLVVLDLVTLPVSAAASLLQPAGKTRGTGTFVFGIFLSILLLVNAAVGAYGELMRDPAEPGAVLSRAAWVLLLFPFVVAVFVCADVAIVAGSFDVWNFLCFAAWVLVLLTQGVRDYSLEFKGDQMMADAATTVFSVIGLIFLVAPIVASDELTIDNRILAIACYGESFIASGFGFLRWIQWPWPGAGTDVVITLGLTANFMGAGLTFWSAWQSRKTRSGEPPQPLAWMEPPSRAPHYTPNGSGPIRADGLGYAVSFYNDAAETRRGPWSVIHTLGAAGEVSVRNIPTDPSGLAHGRRIYRVIDRRGVVLVGQLADNETTEFADDLTT